MKQVQVIPLSGLLATIRSDASNTIVDGIPTVKLSDRIESIPTPLLDNVAGNSNRDKGFKDALKDATSKLGGFDSQNPKENTNTNKITRKNSLPTPAPQRK